MLSEIVAASVNRLQTNAFDPLPLARKLALAASGGHLRVWSADVAEEAVIEHDQLGGGPGTTDPDRAFHLSKTVPARSSTTTSARPSSSTSRSLRLVLR